MTKLINQLSNPPIYTPMNQSTIAQKSGVSALAGTDMVGATHADWQKWLQQLTDLNNVNNYYGNPSVLLNSDFYWNTGVATPTTQADGNGAFFSEKWQVEGAGVATYTLTQTAFPGNDSDQIGSRDYIHVEVASYTSGDFYLYQQQDGSQFLRRYQQRRMNFSMLAYNNQNKSIKLGLEIYFFFDPTDVIYTQAVVFLSPGTNELSSAIDTQFIGNTSVGASPYVQFRLRFIDLVDGTADFNLTYLKAEMADQPTILYVDHALERARIDNS